MPILRPGHVARTLIMVLTCTLTPSLLMAMATTNPRTSSFNQASGKTTDFMHARYYSPNLGRFVSVDSVGGSIGSSQSWNRYSYVNNNPIGLVDPDGRQESPYGIWQMEHPRGYQPTPSTGPRPTTLVVGGSQNFWLNGVGARNQGAFAIDTNLNTRFLSSDGAVTNGWGGVFTSSFSLNVQPGTVDDISTGSYTERTFALAIVAGFDATLSDQSSGVSTKKFDLGIDQNGDLSLGGSVGVGLALGAYTVEGYTPDMVEVDPPTSSESVEEFLSYIEDGGLLGTIDQD